jgi:uncharacterized membrane protein YkvA (DUF1232 family)
MRSRSTIGWKEKAKTLKREVYALYLCSRHPETPLYAKLCALVIVAYALSPIDLIPDFIPVLGYLDDLVLIPAGIVLLIKMMPKDVLEECRRKAEKDPATSGVKSWAGAIIIVLLWIAGILAAVQIVRTLSR